MLYYLTYSKLPKLPKNEIKIVQFLQKQEIEAMIMDWQALDTKQLTASDIVLIRSTWDYDFYPQQFKNFLMALKNSGCLVLNPVDVMLWNMDKRYMLEFQDKGLPVIPTFSKLNATEILEHFPETNFIIAKPVFSAGARGLKRFSRIEFEQAELEDGFLYQPFVPSIPEVGEWSLLFVDGRYSHAVLKKAKSGDFRVQSDYGGTYALVDVPVDWIELGEQFLHQTQEPVLFARVDLVLWKNKPVLIELEVIEPELFLMSDEIVERWAETILGKVSSRNELAQTRAALSGN